MKYSVTNCIRAGFAVLVVSGVTVFGAATGHAQEKTFIPGGHTYAPNAQTLPHPNSRRSKLQTQTDIYETEIYRSQMEAYQREKRFKLFIDHDFFAGSRNLEEF